MRSGHAVCQSAPSSCEISSVHISVGVFWPSLGTTCVLKGNCTFKHFTQCRRYLHGVTPGPKLPASQAIQKHATTVTIHKYQSPLSVDKSRHNLTDLELWVPSKLFCGCPHLHWFAPSCTSEVCVPSTTAILGWQLPHCPPPLIGSAAAWLPSALPGPLNSWCWNPSDHMGANATQRQFFSPWYQSEWVWKLEKGINYSWFQLCWLGSFLATVQHLIPGFSFRFAPLPIPTAALLVMSSQDLHEKSYN